MKATVGSIASYRPLGNSKACRRANWDKFLRLAREVRSLDGAFREEVGPVPAEYHLGRVQRERLRRSEKTAVPLPEVATESKQSDEVYIYGLCDSRDHVVRYVGKTHRHLCDRLYEHEFKPSNRSVCEWLKTLRSAGAKAEAVVLEVCKNFRWQEREIHWIATLRKEHGLLNVAKGGKFYGPPKGKSAAIATQAFHRKSIARSGPVKHLAREEIEMLSGSISPPSKISRFRSGLAGARATSAGTTIQPALVSRG